MVRLTIKNNAFPLKITVTVSYESEVISADTVHTYDLENLAKGMKIRDITITIDRER